MDPSFFEFLSDPRRSGKYYVDGERVHNDIIRGTADFIREYTSKSHSTDMKEGKGHIFWSSLERLISLKFLSPQDATITYLQQSSMSWQPCILSSGSWSSANQTVLACMLSLSKDFFQRLQTPPSSLIRQLRKHLDLAFQIHLFPESISAIQAVLIFLYEEVYPSRYKDKLMVLSGFPQESGYYESNQSFLYAIALLDPSRYGVDHFGERGPLKVVGKDLWDFLGDPGRCGDLYHDRALSYARIADCWLAYLEGIWNAPSECHNIILSHWSRVLSHSTPGDISVIQRLRHFHLGVATNVDADRVIHWLKRAPDTAKDVLLRWQSYSSKTWDSSTKPKGLLSGLRKRLSSRKSAG